MEAYFATLFKDVKHERSLISSFLSLTTTTNLFTNELISKLKIRYTKLTDWIFVITLLYGKILKTSMVE